MISPPTQTTEAASPRRLIGCHFCDALNASGSVGAELICWRCASPLPPVEDTAAATASLGRRYSVVLALLITAVLGLSMAHVLPLVSIELNGQRSSVTLIGATLALWANGDVVLAAAFFVTTVFAPLLEVVGMLGTLVALRRRLRPVQREGASPALVVLLHVWRGMHEWNLIEVLVIGAGVALVKLSQLATLHLEPGLLAMLGFMALFFVAQRFFSPALAWAMVGVSHR